MLIYYETCVSCDLRSVDHVEAQLVYFSLKGGIIFVLSISITSCRTTMRDTDVVLNFRGDIPKFLGDHVKTVNLKLTLPRPFFCNVIVSMIQENISTFNNMNEIFCWNHHNKWAKLFKKMMMINWDMKRMQENPRAF